MESSQGPSVYQRNILSLGQTGSQSSVASVNTIITGCDLSDTDCALVSGANCISFCVKLKEKCSVNVCTIKSTEG